MDCGVYVTWLGSYMEQVRKCAHRATVVALSPVYETSGNLYHDRQYNLIKTIRLFEFRDAAGRMQADR
jgi:hypothetical protein